MIESPQTLLLPPRKAARSKKSGAGEGPVGPRPSRRSRDALARAQGPHRTHGERSARAAEAKMAAQDRLDRCLRDYYRQALNQPVPDHLIELLNGLASRHESPARGGYAQRPRVEEVDAGAHRWSVAAFGP